MHWEWPNGSLIACTGCDRNKNIGPPEIENNSDLKTKFYSKSQTSFLTFQKLSILTLQKCWTPLTSLTTPK